MGYKEGNKGKSTIGAIKPMRRFYMVFEGSVESFDELLVVFRGERSFWLWRFKLMAL